METNERPPRGPVIELLVKKPDGFNLFQAISLLERTSPFAPPLGQGDGRGEAVRLSSVVSLGFAGSDVFEVKSVPTQGAPYRLSTPALALAGAQGPLPMPFTEQVIARAAARDFATADFLDIFQHRLLSFLYRGRKKHNLGLHWGSTKSPALAGSLDALSSLGLRAGVRAPNGEAAWLRHAGLLCGTPRSMSALTTLVRDRFGLACSCRQFRGDWLRLEPTDMLKLGSVHGSPRLGRTAVLGRRVWDQAAGIVLELIPVPLARIHRMVPGGQEHGLLCWVVRRFLQQDLAVEVVLQPDQRGMRASALSREGALRLGWTSWLSALKPKDRTVSPVRFMLKDEAQVTSDAKPSA
jgi:type VI secretion system protein ImpH